LLTAHNGFDLRVEQVAGGKGEFHVFQPAPVNDVYGLMGVCHPERPDRFGLARVLMSQAAFTSICPDNRRG
jgi:hypothetical protein